MPRAPRVMSRRPSHTFPIRAHSDRQAIDRLTALIIEDMRHGLTSAHVVVRQGRGS